MRTVKRKASRTVVLAVVALVMATGLTSCFGPYHRRDHRRHDEDRRVRRSGYVVTPSAAPHLNVDAQAMDGRGAV